MAILLIHTIHMRKQTGCRSALQTLKLLKVNPQSSAMAGSGQTCQTCAPILTEHARNPNYVPNKNHGLKPFCRHEMKLKCDLYVVLAGV